MKYGLNCGCGTRHFKNENGMFWANIDINPECNPDYMQNWNDLSRWDNACVDVVVSHHSMEHVGCGEASGFVREAWRVLKPGGSLLVFVPDVKALVQRWILGQLDTQIFLTNIYGPFDGTEASRHRWGYDREHLTKFLMDCASWSEVKPFDWRKIEGMDAARDWHVLSAEAVKR